LRLILRGSRIVIPATAALWGLFLGGGLLSCWALWDRSLNPASLGYFARGLINNLPAVSLLLFATASLASAMAVSLTFRRFLSRSKGPEVVLTCFLLLLVALGGNAGLWVLAAPPSPNPGNPASCTYVVFLSANSPEAWSKQTHSTVLSSPQGDLGALVNSLPQSNQVICFEGGQYTLDSGIRVLDKSNVSLLFSDEAVLTATSPFRLLQIARSSGVAVMGGKWVGRGFGNVSDIEVDPGSNHVVVEGVDASHAGRDGIIIRNNTTPALQVSILNNFVHGNGRFGIQDIENVTTQSLNILISGNLAEDNARGGIYTNGVGGVNIVGNTVRNTVGTLPGVIGIGVTNGANDTVTDNTVDNMHEYGIQIFYNNNTLVANNFASFNSGVSDQSGITNDHSFYDTIVNNTVLSNGQAGIHVERSSFVTVRGNNATGNGRFGIEFYHGTLASTAHATITQNICNDNGQAGIILNSGTDSLIASNICHDNSGPGIFLYNDAGQVGSSGNIIANNSLGDNRPSSASRTQTYGVETVNGADGNVVVGNTLFNNTISNISVVGTTNVVKGNIEIPAAFTAALTRSAEGPSITLPCQALCPEDRTVLAQALGL
jgi:parallel beta-helix repeat protein